jgi:hypothetical protein
MFPYPLRIAQAKPRGCRQTANEHLAITRIVELLVPATSADKNVTEGGTDRYDDKLRPGLE